MLTNSVALPIETRLAAAGFGDTPAHALLSSFFSRHPQKFPRFLAAFVFYRKLHQGQPIVLNEAVLYRLTNPDQLPATNASCAYYFSHPTVLQDEYDAELEQDVSMLDTHPELMANFLTRISPSETVLSLGFGKALLEKALLKKGGCVTGIEFVPARAEKGRTLGIQVHEGAIHAVLPTITEPFDVIVLSEVLGDLNAREIFAQVKRCLKPGGKILLATYLPDKENDETGYERMWTPSLRSLLAQEGLAIRFKYVAKVLDDDLKIIEPIPAAYDFADAYVFYEIRGMV